MSGYEERVLLWSPETDRIRHDETWGRGERGAPTRKEPGRARFERDRRDGMQVGGDASHGQEELTAGHRWGV